MIEFPTQYNKHELHKVEYSNPGDPNVYKYSSKMDSNGHIDVYEDGIEYNMQDYIDSWKDSVDIKLLVQRFQRGEETALDRIKGTFGDFTNMPKDLMEYYNMMEDGKKFFMTLDPELREQFNQNPMEFFSQYGSNEFYEKIKKFDDDHRPIEQTQFSKKDVEVNINE